MTAVTPGNEELLAELTELVNLSGDPHVSAAALGMRIRNQRQLYADMKQALRLAAKPADEGVREILGGVSDKSWEDLLGHVDRSSIGFGRAWRGRLEKLRTLSTTGEPKR